MSQKKSCCDCFRRVFRRENKADEQENRKNAVVKGSFSDNTEISTHKRTTTTEPKPALKLSPEISIHIADSDSNSLFYDKNSALLEDIDKNKAIENLNEAYSILRLPIPEESLTFRKSDKEMFTKVIKNIDFKAILAADDSILCSENSLPSLSNPN
jgi:hypothetical protein